MRKSLPTRFTTALFTVDYTISSNREVIETADSSLTLGPSSLAAVFNFGRKLGVQKQTCQATSTIHHSFNTYTCVCKSSPRTAHIHKARTYHHRPLSSIGSIIIVITYLASHAQLVASQRVLALSLSLCLIDRAIVIMTMLMRMMPFSISQPPLPRHAQTTTEPAKE